MGNRNRPPASRLVRDGFQRTAAKRLCADRSQRIFGRDADTLLSVLVLVATMAIAFGATQDVFPGDGPKIRLAGVPIAVVGAGLAWRFERRAVIVEQEILVLRNLSTTRTFNASEIETFVQPKRYGAMRHAGLQIVLAEGGSVRASALYANPMEPDYGADETNELIEWLEDARAGRPERLRAKNVYGGVAALMWWTIRATQVLAGLFFVFGMIMLIGDPTGT